MKNEVIVVVEEGTVEEIWFPASMDVTFKVIYFEPDSVDPEGDAEAAEIYNGISALSREWFSLMHKMVGNEGSS